MTVINLVGQGHQISDRQSQEKCEACFDLDFYCSWGHCSEAFKVRTQITSLLSWGRMYRYRTCTHGGRTIDVQVAHWPGEGPVSFELKTASFCTPSKAVTSRTGRELGATGKFQGHNPSTVHRHWRQNGLIRWSRILMWCTKPLCFSVCALCFLFVIRLCCVCLTLQQHSSKNLITLQKLCDRLPSPAPRAQSNRQFSESEKLQHSPVDSCRSPSRLIQYRWLG